MTVALNAANSYCIGRDNRGDARIVSYTGLPCGLSEMDPTDQDHYAATAALHLNATSDFHHGRRIYITQMCFLDDEKLAAISQDDRLDRFIESAAREISTAFRINACARRREGFLSNGWESDQRYW